MASKAGRLFLNLRSDADGLVSGPTSKALLPRNLTPMDIGWKSRAVLASKGFTLMTD